MRVLNVDIYNIKRELTYLNLTNNYIFFLFLYSVNSLL